MFNAAKDQSTAPCSHGQYPAFYPLPQPPFTPVPFGNMATTGPPPPYPYPQQHNIMQQSNIPISQPTPRTWYRITSEEVRNLSTDQPILTISRQSAHNMPEELSSKSMLVISRPVGSLLGTVRFHSLSSSDIDFTVNGHSSKLSDSSMMGSKYSFKPISRGAVTTLGSSGEKWWWKTEGNGSVLHNAKKGGEVLAKIEESSFTFEKAGLSNAECDEILLTAVAVFHKTRKNKKDEGVIEAVLEVVGAA